MVPVLVLSKLLLFYFLKLKINLKKGVDLQTSLGLLSAYANAWVIIYRNVLKIDGFLCRLGVCSCAEVHSYIVFVKLLVWWVWNLIVRARIFYMHLF